MSDMIICVNSLSTASSVITKFPAKDQYTYTAYRITPLFLPLVRSWPLSPTFHITIKSKNRTTIIVMSNTTAAITTRRTRRQIPSGHNSYSMPAITIPWSPERGIAVFTCTYFTSSRTLRRPRGGRGGLIPASKATKHSTGLRGRKCFFIYERSGKYLRGRDFT